MDEKDISIPEEPEIDLDAINEMAESCLRSLQVPEGEAGDLLGGPAIELDEEDEALLRSLGEEASDGETSESSPQGSSAKPATTRTAAGTTTAAATTTTATTAAAAAARSSQPSSKIPAPVSPPVDNNAMIQELKLRAMTAHREGRKEEAFELLRRAKALESQQPASVSTTTATVSTSTTSVARDQSNQIGRVITALELQSTRLGEMTKQLHAGGSEEEKRSALQYFRLRKETQSFLENLRSAADALVREHPTRFQPPGASSSPSPSSPPHLLLVDQQDIRTLGYTVVPTTRAIERETIERDLDPQTLEITLLRAEGLQNPAIKSNPKDLKPLVKLAVDWPSEASAQTFSAPGVSGPDPSWEPPAAATWSVKLIGLANRSTLLATPPPPPSSSTQSQSQQQKLLQQQLQQLKNTARRFRQCRLRVEVKHDRSWSFMFGQPLIGTGELKLTPLLTQCAMREVAVKLRREDDSRNAGTLFFTLRVRTPIESPEKKRLTVAFLEPRRCAPIPLPVVQTAPQPPAIATGTSVAAPVPASVESASSSSSAAAAAAAASSSSSTSTTTTTTAAATARPAAVPSASAIDPALLKNPLHESLYISNDSMELEIESIEAQIAQAKAQGNAEEAERLSDRQSLLKTQLMALVFRVQNQKLSFDDYLDMLRQAIARDLKLAPALKQLNRVPEAIQVMKRLKKMQEELKNAEENAEQLAE